MILLIRFGISSLQIDLQLEGSSLLWSQLEVGIETILKKAEMVEQFVDFASNKAMMERLHHRMDDYQCIWREIRAHLAPMNLTQLPGGIYGFLEAQREATVRNLAISSS